MTRRCFVSRVPARAGRVCAFTLVEMLVAFAVALLLLVTLVGVISQSLAVSRKTNNSLIAFNAAASALDSIANDLESLAVTGQSFEVLQTVKEDVGAAVGVTRLMMLSIPSQSHSSSADFGQARAIRYQVLLQDPISAAGSSPVYGLYRSVVSADDTFATFQGASDLSTPFGSVTASLDDFVAGNIVDFQVQFYPAGNQPAANVNAGAVQAVRLSGTSTTVNGAAYAGVLAWAEITLTVLEDNGAKLLQTGAIDVATAKLRHGHVLTRRVPIRSAL